MNIPRIMIAAAASGSGKTTITCGLLSALKSKGLNVVSGKCGPDYIDPMFHKKVLNVDSQNLDLFFCQPDLLRTLFLNHAANADISVLEGVMGYYDGMGLNTSKASSYELAKELQTPVIPVVQCKGMALSTLAVIKGLVEFRKDSNIKGIILNKVSSKLYPEYKEMIEDGLNEMGHDIKVVGHMPQSDDFFLKSRHLGLVTPEETEDIKSKINSIGEEVSNSIDLDQIIKIGQSAPELKSIKSFPEKKEKTITIGVARDSAFCFYYKDNLNLLEELGCNLIEFSPLKDSTLPQGINGIILGGGYPELHSASLSANKIKDEIRNAVTGGMPCLAECGGFMYLHEEMEGADGNKYKMAGVIKGTSVKKDNLVRFGYINLTGATDGAFLKSGEVIRGHEFHYWDSTDSGTDCTAQKPDKKSSWKCVHMNKNLFAGYPHVHFYSNMDFARRFVEQAHDYKNRGNSFASLGEMEEKHEY